MHNFLNKEFIPFGDIYDKIDEMSKNTFFDDNVIIEKDLLTTFIDQTEEEWGVTSPLPTVFLKSVFKYLIKKTPDITPPVTEKLKEVIYNADLFKFEYPEFCKHILIFAAQLAIFRSEDAKVIEGLNNYSVRAFFDIIVESYETYDWENITFDQLVKDMYTIIRSTIIENHISNLSMAKEYIREAVNECRSFSELLDYFNECYCAIESKGL